jgi:glycosyltransferase involved in cell wall biosynthesis
MYGCTVFSWLTGGNWPPKYNYVLELVREGKIGIVFDHHGSSLPIKLFRNKWLAKLFGWVECFIWMKINRLKITKTKFTFSTNKLIKGDVLFLFAFEHLQSHPIPDWTAPNDEVVKLIHFSHYFFRTTEIAENLKLIKNSVIVSEIDLCTHSLFYKKYFSPNESKALILPFAVQRRFKEERAFSLRQKKALAVGSFMTFKRADYNQAMCDFYDTNTIHPLRKIIWYNRAAIEDKIVCKISYINEFWDLVDTEGLSGIRSRVAFVKNFVTKKFSKNWGKSNHYKEDIVEQYNSFQMVISTEEAGELPSIGIFEAMACGCAAICSNNVEYKSIGMIGGLHYIAYDGTFENLLEQIDYYQTHQTDLANIAKAGEGFVCDMFRIEEIKKIFIEGSSNQSIEK